MPIYYQPPYRGNLGYWYAHNPSQDDLENMLFLAGAKKYFNVVVVGKPKRISPDWLALHPGYKEGDYDYAVSYSIPARTFGYMLDETETPLDAFNMYLDDLYTGKEWISIDTIKMIDRPNRRN